MNKIAQILSARKAFLGSLLFAAILLAFLAPKAAVNVDELLHYPHAKKVVNWYFTGGQDVSCMETPVTNLKYYGQSVDNLTAFVNRVFHFQNEFQLRHFVGALFYLLLLVFAGLIGYQLTASFWVSALTVLSILAMPRLFGQAFGNLKDIPFAAGYLAAIYMIIRFVKELPKPKWSSAILLGLAIAFTSSVRIGGLILFAYLGLAIIATLILKPFFLKHIVSTKHCLGRLLGQGFVIVVIGYFAGLLFWPFALQDVFRNPLESLSVMEHYKVSIRQIFEGNLLWSTQLPWYYLPKWILISTPEFILLGFIISIISLFRYKFKPTKSKQLYLELFVLFTLLFPLVYVVIIGSNLYSGVRQMIFVLPLFAVFASIGFFTIIHSMKKKSVKIGVSILLLFLMILPIKHQAATFPADYIYFNSVSGGNENAWSNYEYDYYFHGIKKSSDYLIDLIGNENAIVATNCNLSNYFENEKNLEYVYSRYLERSEVDWDYALFGVNYIHPTLLKNGNWKSTEIIKTFYHSGNPIAVILQRKDKMDYTGLQKLEAGKYEKAEKMIQNAISNDPNNVWLFAQLAKKSLEQKDFKSFNRYLQNGKEIYTLYEPLFLLEAQYLYSRGEFVEAKVVLDQLIEINPRYKNAAPLLKEVNNKLNIDL